MKTERKVAAFAVIFGLIAWVACATLEYHVFHADTFWGVLLVRVSGYSICIRSAIVVCFLVFGLLIGRLMAKNEEFQNVLAAEKERLAVTLRSIGDGVICTDVEGRITSINRLGEIITGWLEQQVLGKPLGEVFKIIDEETGDPCPNPAQRVLESGRVVELAEGTLLVCKDGTELLIADSAAPVRNEDGEVVGVVLVFRDVTEERRRAAQEGATNRRLRLSVEHMRDGYALHEAIFDHDGRMKDFRYIEINPRAEKLMGKSRHEIVGKTALELFPALAEQGIIDQFAEVVANSGRAFIKDFRYAEARHDKAFNLSCYRVDPDHFVCMFSESSPNG